ncbi:MAG: MFS transporter, partial [Clostridia bacterium]|nr:MFS transporter [Clostridia bacterium]
MGALMSCSSALIQPLWGVLCDRYGCHRSFYIASGIITPLIYLWIILSGSAAELIICALLSGIFINCIQNMANGWIAGLNAEGHSINYGATRSFGSLAFAIMAVVLGKVADLWGFFALVAGMAVCGLCCVGFSISIPKIVTAPRPERGEPAPTLREGLKVLFAQREYMVLVLCGFLAMFGLTGIVSYYPVLLADMG